MHYLFVPSQHIYPTSRTSVQSPHAPPFRFFLASSLADRQTLVDDGNFFSSFFFRDSFGTVGGAMGSSAPVMLRPASSNWCRSTARQLITRLNTRPSPIIISLNVCCHHHPTHASPTPASINQFSISNFWPVRVTSPSSLPRDMASSSRRCVRKGPAHPIWLRYACPCQPRLGEMTQV